MWSKSDSFQEVTIRNHWVYRWLSASGGSTLGPGGTDPPNVGQPPPQIFGQQNFFLQTGNQEIIELSILSHIACYLT
jgi:hypothetical protein